MAKILIVDDDPDMTEACKVLLELKGHQVISANNKEDGLKAIEEIMPDLLILDVMMAQADDGIVMAQNLKKKDAMFPILMVSGIGTVTGLNYDKDNTTVPVDAFLEKPVEPSVLIAKVNELLKIQEV